MLSEERGSVSNFFNRNLVIYKSYINPLYGLKNIVHGLSVHTMLLKK